MATGHRDGDEKLAIDMPVRQGDRDRIIESL